MYGTFGIYVNYNSVLVVLVFSEITCWVALTNHLLFVCESRVHPPRGNTPDVYLNDSVRIVIGIEDAPA